MLNCQFTSGCDIMVSLGYGSACGSHHACSAHCRVGHHAALHNFVRASDIWACAPMTCTKELTTEMTMAVDSAVLHVHPSMRHSVGASCFLQVHNLTTQPQEVQVLVQEAHGFVFAGSKQQVVNIVPCTLQTITWTLVAHASGQLQLPTVRVSCTKLGCSTVTQGGPIHVMPY